MKPIKFKKLRFHKETIADLPGKKMTAAHGGKEEFLSYRCPIPTYTDCMTQCPSNDSAPQACCFLC